MYYDINVSLKGLHFFGTAEHSVTSDADLQAVYPIIEAKFPKSEGYSIKVTQWRTTGEEFNESQLEELLK